MSPYAVDGAAPPTLEDIRAAEQRIHQDLPATPAVLAFELADQLGQPLRLKTENFQRTGSFKARGALNWICSASPQELRPGLITVSAGNHALALAWAAQRRGAQVTVVMPEGSSPLKIEATRAFGAEVIIHGSIQEAVAFTHRLQEQRGLTLVHPYDDPRIIAGQGTLGLELLRQIPSMARILCPIGGGGLISGIGLAVRAQRPDVALIGVEPEGAATMHNAWQRQDPNASLPHVDTLAASLAPAIVGQFTYTLARQWVNEVVTVADDTIRSALRLILSHGHLYAEPGAVVALAALLAHQVPTQTDSPTVIVVTGGNLDPAQLCKLL